MAIHKTHPAPPEPEPCPLCRSEACQCHPELAGLEVNVGQALWIFAHGHENLGFKKAAHALLRTLRPYFLDQAAADRRSEEDASLMQRPLVELCNGDLAGLKARYWLLKKSRVSEEEDLLHADDIADFPLLPEDERTLGAVIETSQLNGDTVLTIRRRDGTMLWRAAFDPES